MKMPHSVAKKKSKGDIAWYLPDAKRPFAQSTKATSDYIEALARGGKTMLDVYKVILLEQDPLHDIQAVEIVAHYITSGHANHTLEEES